MTIFNLFLPCLINRALKTLLRMQYKSKDEILMNCKQFRFREISVLTGIIARYSFSQKQYFFCLFTTGMSNIFTMNVFMKHFIQDLRKYYNIYKQM